MYLKLENSTKIWQNIQIILGAHARWPRINLTFIWEVLTLVVQECTTYLSAINNFSTEDSVSLTCFSVIWSKVIKVLSSWRLFLSSPWKVRPPKSALTSTLTGWFPLSDLARSPLPAITLAKPRSSKQAGQLFKHCETTERNIYSTI